MARSGKVPRTCNRTPVRLVGGLDPFWRVDRKFPPSHRSPGRQEKTIAKFKSFGEELHARQRPCRLSASGLVSGRQASKRMSKGIVIVIRTRKSQ